jgi:hypothetical protein
VFIWRHAGHFSTPPKLDWVNLCGSLTTCFVLVSVVFCARWRRWLGAALSLLTVVTLSAQSPALGSWNILNLRYRVAPRWSVYTEAQLRSLGFYHDFHYHEWVGGVIFRPNQQVALTLAVGDYDTYQEGGDFVRPKNSNEIRVWPQLTFTQVLGRVRLEHRYRSEQRFTNRGFRLRFRSRVGVLVPLNSREIRNGTWFVNASNELFFTNREPYFERNRLLLVLGRRFSEQVTAHLGYVHQFDYRINDETGRDFLQVALQWELPARRSSPKGQ